MRLRREWGLRCSTLSSQAYHHHWTSDSPESPPTRVCRYLTVQCGTLPKVGLAENSCIAYVYIIMRDGFTERFLPSFFLQKSTNLPNFQEIGRFWQNLQNIAHFGKKSIKIASKKRSVKTCIYLIKL